MAGAASQGLNGGGDSNCRDNAADREAGVRRSLFDTMMNTRLLIATQSSESLSESHGEGAVLVGAGAAQGLYGCED